MKTASLFITLASTALLVGCASKLQQPTYTPQQLAYGIKLEKITANMPLSTKYSRAWSIAHVFRECREFRVQDDYYRWAI